VDLGDIIFHRDDQEIKKIKSAIKRIPEGTIQYEEGEDKSFDVEFLDGLVNIYPKNERFPVFVHAKTLAFEEDKYSIFQIGRTKYKLFYDKKIIENPKSP
jgi:hypothetical protein